MIKINKQGIVILAALFAMLTGCAARTTITPVNTHRAYVADTKVVYHVTQPNRHCWRHRKHWHCR